MILNQQKIVNDKGQVTGFLIKKSDFIRLKEYIEDIEDSIELSESIKNSQGFRIWDDFIKENNICL